MPPVYEVAESIKAMYARCPKLCRQVLGDLVQECDRGRDFVEGRNNYAWFWLAGHYYQPRRILEIGVRFGYSLWAVASAVTWSPPLFMELTVYDAEVDADVEPLKICEVWFKKEGFRNLTVHRIDTQALTKLDCGQVDFATVDANHSEAGAYHDCELAWGVLRPGGVLLVDDTNPGVVRKAAERFAADMNVEFAFLPSLRGIHILGKPE